MICPVSGSSSFDDAHVTGLAAHGISDDVGDALALVRREDGLVPTFGFESAGIIDRKACIVADLNALAVVDVFVSEIAPLAGEVDLRRSGCDAKAQTHKGTKKDGFVFSHKTGMLRQKWKNGKHPDV